MTRRLLLLLLAILIPTVAHAQTDSLPPLQPITPDNASQLVQIGRLGSGDLRSIVWSPDGSALLIASSIGVWVQDAADPDVSVLLDMPAGANSIAASLDYIAAGSDDGTVYVWERASLDQAAAFGGHLYAVASLTFSGDGSRLASGDNSGVVRLWNMDNLTEFTTLESAGQPYRAPDELVFSSTGAFARIGYCDALEIVTLDPAVTRQPISGFMCPLLALAFVDDSHLVAYSETGATYTWDLATQTVEQHPTSQPLDDDPAVTATSPDGTLTATGGNDGLVRLIDAATGEERARLFGHMRGINGVAFSPDGSLIVSASLDRTVQIWSVDAVLTSPDTPALVVLAGHTAGVNAVAFNADGTIFASAGYDGTIRLWVVQP